MKSGPIIIIEDDADDKSVLDEIFREMNIGNKIVWFQNCKDAFQYLKTTVEQPFLILSDVNMPGQKGTEFKKELDNDPQLRKKSIPFVFYSTSVDQDTVNEAYTAMTVQGFFQKKQSYDEIRKSIGVIVEYWQYCRHPNTR